MIESRYSKLDQVKFVEDSLKKFEVSRPYHFKNFQGCLPKILLGPFLNTLTQMKVKNMTKVILIQKAI